MTNKSIGDKQHAELNPEQLDNVAAGASLTAPEPTKPDQGRTPPMEEEVAIVFHTIRW